MNKTQKAYALSIIIPVYNEENYLGDCLQAIAEQTVKPLEVIVVDNNSSDGTVNIARAYDFVTVIKENRQHQSFAQHKGFSLAKGDIVGRIDADTILPKDWIKEVLAYFSENPETAAVSGSGKAYDVVLAGLGKAIFNAYFKMAGAFAGHNLMWGSNCAFRRSAWPKISSQLSLRNDIWEDYDLAFCLAQHGRIDLLKNIDVLISYRSIHRPLAKQARYQYRSVRTFRIHRSLVRSYGFALTWFSMIVVGPVVLTDHYVIRPIKNLALVKLFLSRVYYLFDV